MKSGLIKSLIIAGSLLSLVACGGNGKGADGKVKDDSVVLTVLTQRTDLASTVFPEYSEKFKALHPEIKEVRFEASDDYENTVKTRMNTKDYGDVLLIPNGILNDDLGNFFEPFGEEAQLKNEYKGLTKISGGKVYGIPSNLNAAGTILYNKEAFTKAGITSFPKNPQELYEAAKKLKAAGIIPLYTNYAAKWTFAQWDDGALAMAADRQYKLSLINDSAPFSPGKPYYELYKIMYEMAKNKYIEDDPVTSDWEGSKQMLADGKIGMMVLASWAYPQITALASNKDSIGLGIFPLPTKDGKNYLSVSGDYNLAINKNSEHKELAKQFVEFFIKESGYVQNYGVISPDKNAKNPAYVEDLLKAANGNILEEVYNPKPEEEKRLKQIQDNSGIDITNSADFKQEIIDAGMQGKSFDDIMKKLNEKWAKEVAKK